MGVVYLAHHENLGREVAIKALSEGVVADSDALERFRREGKIAARLRHAHIVQVYDFFEDHGRYYIAMEYLGSRTLERLIRERGPLPLKEALRLTDQLLDALHHAHQLGVVHRDIKPANVMITDTHNAALTDFSIAHVQSAAKLTQAGTVIGTPEYMAPEQFDGKSDARSDLYATGLILYEMLTGFSPFRAESVSEIMKKQILTMPDPPCEVDFTVPQPISDVVLKALAKDPGDRYESAFAMRAAVRQAYQASHTKVEPLASVHTPPVTQEMPVAPDEVPAPPVVPKAPEEAPRAPSPPQPVETARQPSPVQKPVMSAGEFLEHHGSLLLFKGGAASVGLVFLAGLLPGKLAVLPALIGVLSAFSLAMAGFALSLFLFIRRLPVAKAALPIGISFAIGMAMTVVAVINSALRH